MTSYEVAHLRRQIESTRRADLANAVLLMTARIGGHAALVSALNETRSERAAQRARRLRGRATREVRA